MASITTAAGVRLVDALKRQVGEDARAQHMGLRAVNDAMDAAGLPITRMPRAIDATAALRNSRDFVEVTGPIEATDLNKFPVGTVFIAEHAGKGRSHPGVIAVKIEEQGDSNWCSDFRHGPVIARNGYDNIKVFIPTGGTASLQRAQ